MLMVIAKATQAVTAMVMLVVARAMPLVMATRAMMHQVTTAHVIMAVMIATAAMQATVLMEVTVLTEVMMHLAMTAHVTMGMLVKEDRVMAMATVRLSRQATLPQHFLPCQQQGLQQMLGMLLLVGLSSN